MANVVKKVFKFLKKEDLLIDNFSDQELEEYGPNQQFSDDSMDIPRLEDELRSIYLQQPQDSSSEQSYFVPDAEQTEEEFEKHIQKLTNKDSNACETQCVTCSKQVRLQNVASVKRGDHLCFPGEIGKNYDRKKRVLRRFYTHHAIVKEVLLQSDTKAEMVLIHFTRDSNSNIEICETTETYDLTRVDIDVVEYTYPKYPADKVVKRAESKLLQNATEENPRFKYNPFTCNCEHFANWCVMGDQNSLQVSGLREKIRECVVKLFGAGSLIAEALLRLSFFSSDEIAAALTKATNVQEIVVGSAVGVYLIYCILVTVVFCRRHQNKKMCSPCLKVNLIDLWSAFSVFGVTSTMSFLIFKFALPLMAPGVGIPLEIMLVLVSCAVHKSVPLIRKALMSPMHCSKMKISSLDQLNVGDIISLRYYRIAHDLIVTEVHADSECEGRIRCIHYSLPKMFGTREITEEYLDINLNNQTVYLYDTTHLERVSGEEVVSKARKRIGEQKWNMISNKSSHLCLWAISKGNKTEKCCSDKALKFNPSSSLLLDKEMKEVHLLNEIQKGDVVNYRGLGIVVDLKSLDGENYREFEMDLVTFEVKRLDYEVHKRTLRVNLHKERLYVKHFNPVLCHSMKIRIQRAEEWVGRKGKRRKIKQSIEECILREEKMGHSKPV